MELVHFSNEETIEFRLNPERGNALYCFEKDNWFDYVPFNNNIITKKMVEDKIEELHADENYEDDCFYKHIGFYYGSIMHILNKDITNMLDLTEDSTFSSFFVNNNICSSEQVADIFPDNWYDTEYEIKMNKIARELGYDAIRINDHTDGVCHITIIILK